MNEGGLLAWKRKTRQPRAAGWGWSGLKAAGRNRAAARSGFSRARCPLSSLLQPGPAGSDRSCGRRPGRQAQAPARAPSEVARQYRALRVEAAEAPPEPRPTCPAAPTTSQGDEKVERGGRGGRRTQEPLPPPALNLPSLASPSRPSPATHSPRLTSTAASEQEGGGEHEQEKQKQAGEEPHGAARSVSTGRPRELSAAPAIMALLFIRAPSGEGRGTYHARTFATPPSAVAERRQRGCH